MSSGQTAGSKVLQEECAKGKAWMEVLYLKQGKLGFRVQDEGDTAPNHHWRQKIPAWEFKILRYSSHQLPASLCNE